MTTAIQKEPASAPRSQISTRATMNVVIVGHVDHGKSTLVGRLLADTGVLGDGKLEKVVETCKRQGKAFEYAFLLDALEEEQGQGITIDSARVFFRSDRRDYIIIDAPGHVEFLKNMVTGAARAEAALLLIDANEGVKDNSLRHGTLLSMLGIRQVVVAINKIDLVGYSRSRFEEIAAEYQAFLAGIGIEAQHVIPVSAREGDQLCEPSPRLAWYQGPTILEALDGFEEAGSRRELPLRFPVQDVYKFNHVGDDRRIIAGRIESGALEVGDELLFSPSGKRASVASIEAFSAEPKTRAIAGSSVGITLDEQVYVRRGELISRVQETQPSISTRLRANLFWLGREPMVDTRRYKLKLGTAETEVVIDEVVRVLDATELGTELTPGQIRRHQVAEVVLRTRKPIAFDVASELEVSGRFVIVDGYDIAGGGIVREARQDSLEQSRLESRIRDVDWVRSSIDPDRRSEANGHPASMLILVGDGSATVRREVGLALERQLFEARHQAYLLDGKNVYLGVDADIAFDDVDELVRRFGEVAHILLDAGTLVIASTGVIGLADCRRLATQIAPFELLVAHFGSEAEGLPEGADLLVEPTAEPRISARSIAASLQRRGWLRDSKP